MTENTARGPGQVDPSVEPLPFYFDFISPYAYLGWRLLRRWEQQGRLRLVPRPVLFAGLLNAHGTLGPAEVPAKRRYVFLDARRKAERLEIEIERPHAHPFNPLGLLRISLAADSETRSLVVDTLFAGVWCQRLDVLDEQAVGSLLARAVGEADCSRLLERATAPEIKQKLREETARAVDQGIFGVPTIDRGGEIFWGVDSFDDLERALQRSPRDLKDSWDDIPVQAVRRTR